MLIHLLDAVQIFGGRGLTVTGMGKFVESVSIFPAVEFWV